MISVVMPVLNEAQGLAQVLAQLLSQAGTFEVIVVDGGSTDDTVAVAVAVAVASRNAGVRVLHSGKGRGTQMNVGAAASTGDTLLFLHADTRLPEGAIGRIEAVLREHPGCGGGAFRHAFTPTDWQLRLVSFGNNLRCRRSRVYFGDQAIFVRAALFWQVGGFPEVACLEDVIFCERLRTMTRTLLLPEAVHTDSRRFRHHGVWRSTWRGVRLLARHRLGLSVDGHGYADEVR